MPGLLNERSIQQFENQPFENTPKVRQASDFMPRVLIADDDDDNRQMLKFLLEMWSCSVIEAGDGTEAVQVAEKTRPDLILMDIRMPGFDGLEATRRIRESVDLSEVPVVVLSACAEAVYRQAASAAGANDYLTKPFDFDELESTLKKYFRY